MLLEITDIGGGIVEIVYNDASAILKSRLLRKDTFYDIQLIKDGSYINIGGTETLKISYQAVSRIGIINNPVSNQVVYDELKAMMIA